MGFTFGAPAPTAAPTGGLFGAPAPAPTATAPTPSSGGLFGATPATSTPAPAAGGLFGGELFVFVDSFHYVFSSLFDLASLKSCLVE
jgi:hypothetical protein